LPVGQSLHLYINTYIYIFEYIYPSSPTPSVHDEAHLHNICILIEETVVIMPCRVLCIICVLWQWPLAMLALTPRINTKINFLLLRRLGVFPWEDAICCAAGALRGADVISPSPPFSPFQFTVLFRLIGSSINRVLIS